MNKRIIQLSAFIMVVILMAACASMKKSKLGSTDSNLYLIETEYGNMKVKLYDETPQHRDNFKKLVADTFYNGTLFHRVINGFMIQGGDPDSKNAKPGQRLGVGNLNYTVPAEFVDSLIHKKGALAAARQGDQVNPDKRSSGSQFYIVHGSKVNKQSLKSIAQRVNGVKKRALGAKVFNDSTNATLKANFLKARGSGNADSTRYYGKIIEEKIEEAFKGQEFKYSEKNIAIYDSLGGAPHLDGQYTVFGEVIEGLNVIDSIAGVQKDKSDRPIKDIKMTIKKL